MKYAENLLLEIWIRDDGSLQARRKDRKPMTDDDHRDAHRLADRLPGITVADGQEGIGGEIVILNPQKNFE